MTTIGIGTVAELESFRDRVNNGETQLNAILTADIDLSSVSSWTPIGTSSNQYAGTFDGNGHVIKNLSVGDVFIISSTSGVVQNIGFFGCTLSYCFIWHGNLNNIYIYDCTSLSFKGLIADFSTCQNILIDSSTVSITAKSSDWQYVNMINNGDGHLNNAIITESCTLSLNTPSQTYIGIYSGAFLGGVGGNVHPYFINVVTQLESIQVSYASGSLFRGAICGSFDSSRTATFNNCYRTTSWSGSLGSNYVDGTAVSLSTMQQQSFYTTASNWDASYPWDFSNTWYWDSTANLPKLRVFQNPKPTMRVCTGYDANNNPIWECGYVQVYNGSNWVEPNKVYVYNGSQWVEQS